ncbi:signal peptidase I [Merdibacter massiliensis]|uniref:signal peptidase I n=1 Tax=Merdibacter massiliensis TaxID=1871030 RepID=UPI00096AC780|nr:signal peptidase I [Merdibacter massiliensis]
MEENEKKIRGLQWEVFDFVKILLICFIVALGIKTFIAQPVYVDGSSMYPTLEDGEFGFTNLLGLRLDGIQRGDIVIVSHENEYWVKRVIGLPNETIECKDGVVYIDGKVLKETYLNTDYVKDIEKSQGVFTSDFGPVTLGDDEYFVMGDNRVVSADSRIVGPFKRDQIVGKGVFVLLPFDQIGYHNQ